MKKAADLIRITLNQI